MVKKSGVRTVKDLNRTTICFQSATTPKPTSPSISAPTACDSFRSASTAPGKCDALTDDISALHVIMASNPQYSTDYAVLAQAISNEPFSPAVRHGDHQFADIVRWTEFAMAEAEQYGITSKNVDELLKSDNPSIKRILGVIPGMGKALGVDEMAKATTATSAKAYRSRSRAA